MPKPPRSTVLLLRNGEKAKPRRGANRFSGAKKPRFEVVGTAADGEALVSEARRLHPDVIVTDISMPILNGIDAMRKLRESGSTAKFVFVTVHSEEEFVEACMEAGALGYVRKSCLNHDLVPAIKAALAGQP